MERKQTEVEIMLALAFTLRSLWPISIPVKNYSDLYHLELNLLVQLQQGTIFVSLLAPTGAPFVTIKQTTETPPCYIFNKSLLEVDL